MGADTCAPKRTCTHTHARARMCDVGACVGHARIGDACFNEDMRMDIDICIYHEYKYCIGCVASKRASHSRTCRAEPYRQHAHAIARAYMGDTTTESLTYISISQASTSIYVYIYIYLTCASLYAGVRPYTYRRTYTHAQNVTGRIVGTRNRTHVDMEAMHPHAHSQPTHHRSIQLSTACPTGDLYEDENL